MLPVYQTKTVHVDGYGDCFNACLASILELPIEEIPEIYPITKGDWHNQWRLWLADQGLKIDYLLVDEDEVPDGFSIASVDTSRVYPDTHRKAGENISHAVVCLKGEVIHDPFPGGSEITRIKYHQVLLDMTLEEKLQHAKSRGSHLCNHGYIDECIVCNR